MKRLIGYAILGTLLGFVYFLMIMSIGWALASYVLGGGILFVSLGIMGVNLIFSE